MEIQYWLQVDLAGSETQNTYSVNDSILTDISIGQNGYTLGGLTQFWKNKGKPNRGRLEKVFCGK